MLITLLRLCEEARQALTRVLDVDVEVFDDCQLNFWDVYVTVIVIESLRVLPFEHEE